MQVTVTSTFPATVNEVWDAMRRSSTLVYITKGMMRFTAADSFPEFWQEQEPVHTHLRLFGRVPAGEYHIRFVEISEQSKIMKTKESGGAITRWNHTMRVKPAEDGGAVYSDTIDIRAGILTIVVCLWAKVFYLYRHRRLRRLLKK